MKRIAIALSAILLLVGYADAQWGFGHVRQLATSKVTCSCKGDPLSCTCGADCGCIAGGRSCFYSVGGLKKDSPLTATFTTSLPVQQRTYTAPGWLIGGATLSATPDQPLEPGVYQAVLTKIGPAPQRAEPVYDTKTIYRDPVVNRRWRYVDQAGNTEWLPEPPQVFVQPAPMPMMFGGFSRGSSC